MKMPERSHTSRAPQCTVLLPKSLFVMMDGHTHKGQPLASFIKALWLQRALTDTQTDMHADSSDSINSTADAGGNIF